ncbi:NADP-dependent oxidoreductase [Pedobacter sp. KR3-3]|uniref:NADP-dependent oxidoreductase n=1 Tax=Pedobacter albus TaxID=3113905 RepID=A0ABU7I401_9SPHI|nr:NADP-dependent oxidoreductase [Pedobacter sp. KR3-3]MEE1944187.1 NADP-dependent oxidoreductase [Pedobacter sp. KR3-3]
MKAIILTQPGGVENLKLTTVEKPKVARNGVLIKVKAISINPVDWKTRRGTGVYGRLKDLNPLIIGWDVSGVVESVGEDVVAFKSGDEVFGMVNFPGHGQAYAEYVAAPADHLALKPANISHEEAAAATLAALTAWQVLVTYGNVQAGQKVLVHAAAGGVGHYGVQIAKHLGAYVIGTSSAAKKDIVMDLGADEHIDYTSQKFEELVQDADLVFDTVGGENFVRSLDAVKPHGWVISIPSGMSGDIEAQAKAKGVNARAMLVESNGKDMQLLAGLLASGKMKSLINSVYPFEQMGAAHTELEQGKATGKIMVTL